MTLRVSGKNMDVGDALRGKAEDHFAAVVGKYFDGGYDGHLTLTPDGIGFRADCVVHLDSGATLQANAQGGDATSAYELMALNIEKRLRRYNRKLKQRPRGIAGSADGARALAPSSTSWTRTMHRRSLRRRPKTCASSALRRRLWSSISAVARL